MSGPQQSNTCGREAEPPPYTEQTPLFSGYRNSNPDVYRPAPTVVNYRSSRITISNAKRDQRILTLIVFVFILLFGFMTGYSFDSIWNAQHRNSLRRAWKIEDDRRADLNRKWEEQEAKHRERERQREGMERRRKEEEERKRTNIAWEDMRASDHCLQYGTREYQAKLGNVDFGLDPLEECARKPALIHGRKVLPLRCAREGVCGAAYGHWIVDFKEDGCMPSWGAFADKGCIRPGIKRWEARLWNLNPNDDWFEMCRSTPATINGVTLNGPNDCVDYGFVHGKWGIWAIPDPNCKMLQGPMNFGAD